MSNGLKNREKPFSAFKTLRLYYFNTKSIYWQAFMTVIERKSLIILKNFAYNIV